MCGILGYKVRAGHKLSPFESTVLCTVLTKEMENRGRDSWGGVILPSWASEESDKTNAIIFRDLGKITATGHAFIKAASTAQAILAHTRAATVGAVSKANCHPFLIGDVLGVHNGSVSNYKELNALYGRDFEVDSQQIFAHINDSLNLEEVEGHGTFFFSKKSDAWKNIYLARTNGGSLFLARLFRDNKHKEHFVTLWASEKNAVVQAADMIGAYLGEVNISPDQLYHIGEDGEIYDDKEPYKLKSNNFARYTGGFNKHGTSSAENYWSLYTAEPLESNITEYALTVCTRCNCPLAKHAHGHCKDNQFADCKTARNARCLDIKNLIACRACGCYLVNSIHKVKDGKLTCTICVKECNTIVTTEFKNVTTPKDTTNKSDSSVIPFLSKRAKKKLAKKYRKLELSPQGTTNITSPLPKNIWPIISAPRSFRNQDGVTVCTPICEGCYCPLDIHLWGRCTGTTCKSSKKANACKSKTFLCSDCGHNMVESIHEPIDTASSDSNKAIFCTVCLDFCCSLVAPDDEEVETEVEPVDEASDNLSDEELLARLCKEGLMGC